jgi:hypothetical protein
MARGGPTKNIYLPLARVHVNGGDLWQYRMGTDYWLMPAGSAADDPTGAAATTSGPELAESGWTVTSIVNTAGSGGDFLGGTMTAGVPADPGSPNHFLSDASGDLAVSPVLFGDYGHGLAASKMVGRNTRPTKLVLETYSAFTVASADEPTTGFGFFEDATTTTSATEALQHSFISSNGTNFELNTNASTSLTSVGATVASVGATFHLWRIEYRFATDGTARAYWYIDDELQGSILPTTDEFPLAFGVHSLTTNRVGLGWVHIYYDW